MKLYFNYAETYIEELKELGGLPMFTLKAIVKKNLNLDSYVKKHFPTEGYSVKYAVEHHDYISVGGKKFPIITADDDLESVDSDFAVKVPNLRISKSRAINFLNACIKKRDELDVSIFGLNISACHIIENFPFDCVSVNPQQIARFKEVILPTSKRVSSVDWPKIVKHTKGISALGYTTQDIHNASYSDLVKFNIKSYQFVAEKRENLEQGKLIETKPMAGNLIVTKKDKYVQNKIDKHIENKDRGEIPGKVVTPMKDKVKRFKISAKGVEARKTMLICDNCLVRSKCLDYSEGSVCSKKKQFQALAKKFKSRNVPLIVEGLTDILATQSERYQRGKDFEEMDGGVIDSDVTGLENSLFKNTRDLILLLTGKGDGDTKPGNTFNIKNVNVNIAEAMGELNENLTSEEQKDLSDEIKGIIKERRYEESGNSSVAS